MKKIKWLFLATLVLITVLALASCGSNEFADLIDEQAAPVVNPAYQSVTQLPQLTDMVDGQADGDLQVFTKKIDGKSKYIVYDLANNVVVWSQEDNSVTGTTTNTDTSYKVELDTINDATFFKVTTTVKITSVDGSAPETEKKSFAIYAWNGAAYAEIASLAQFVETPQIQKQQDLLFFDNKCYRVDENNVIAFAFDYPVFAKFPELKYSTENYYISDNDGIWITYDKSLNRVSAFQAPSYENVDFSVVLGDQIFMQSTIVEDPYTNRYDLITVEGANVQKKSLKTFMVDVESGKVKNIRCNYKVEESVTTSIDEAWALTYGLAEGKKEVALIKVAKIDDKRTDKSDMAKQWALLNEKGQIKVLELPTTMPVETFTVVSANTWLLETVDGCAYLVDANGEIKGEITAKEYRNNAYIVAGGKIYNYNLEMVYDYKAENLTRKAEYTSNTAVYLTNSDGELFVFANNQKTSLILKGMKREYYSHENNAYMVIKDTNTEGLEKYDIYNAEGLLLKSEIINTAAAASLQKIEKVASTKKDGTMLIVIKTRNANQEPISTYYTLK